LLQALIVVDNVTTQHFESLRISCEVVHQWKWYC